MARWRTVCTIRSLTDFCLGDVSWSLTSLLRQTTTVFTMSQNIPARLEWTGKGSSQSIEGTQTVTLLPHVLYVEHAPKVPCARHPRTPTVSIVTNLPYLVSRLHWTHSSRGPDPSLALSTVTSSLISPLAASTLSFPRIVARQSCVERSLSSSIVTQNSVAKVTHLLASSDAIQSPAIGPPNSSPAYCPSVTRSKELHHATSTLEGSQNVLSDS
jgi:hypothetical protein